MCVTMFAFAQRHYCARDHFMRKILLPVQCYAMHGQNINLPVCMCVCVRVRHTFCQLAYRSDPSDFFTVDSLKDAADLRKDVPFGGLDDE